jgi:myo-inositol-1(or 4)-monophosphatase
MDATLAIAIKAARAAGKIIARAADHPKSLTVSEKGHNDFVTEIDGAAETAIMQVISEAHPTHSFLTEESGQIDHANTDAVWIIDPLDGTTNFIHGLPNYVVSIGFRFKGIMEYGVIYHPLTQDLFVAARGQGAQLNGKRIRVSTQTKLDGALISVGLPRPIEYLPAYLALNQAFHGQIAGIRRSGATALDLAYVAAGMLDFFWNIDSKIWDIAAGVLLVKEAGGIITDHRGGEEYWDHGNIIAGAPKLIKPALQLIHQHLPKGL